MARGAPLGFPSSRAPKQGCGEVRRPCCPPDGGRGGHVCRAPSLHTRSSAGDTPSMQRRQRGGRRHTWSGSRGTESRHEQAQHLHPQRLPGSPMALPPSRCRGRDPRAAARLAPCPAEVRRKPARHPGAGCGGGSILPQQTAARPGGKRHPGGGRRRWPSLGDLATCSQGPHRASGAAQGAAGPRGAAPRRARDPRGEGVVGATLHRAQPPHVAGSWGGQHGVSGVPPSSGSTLG